MAEIIHVGNPYKDQSDRDKDKDDTREEIHQREEKDKGVERVRNACATVAACVYESFQECDVTLRQSWLSVCTPRPSLTTHWTHTARSFEREISDTLARAYATCNDRLATAHAVVDKEISDLEKIWKLLADEKCRVQARGNQLEYEEKIRLLRLESQRESQRAEQEIQSLKARCEHAEYAYTQAMSRCKMLEETIETRSKQIQVPTEHKSNPAIFSPTTNQSSVFRNTISVLHDIQPSDANHFESEIADLKNKVEHYRIELELLRQSSRSKSQNPDDSILVEQLKAQIEALQIQKSGWELRKRNLEDEIIALHQQASHQTIEENETKPSASARRLSPGQLADIQLSFGREQRDSGTATPKVHHSHEPFEAANLKTKSAENSESQMMGASNATQDNYHHDLLNGLTELASFISAQRQKALPHKSTAADSQSIQWKNIVKALRDQLEEMATMMSEPLTIRPLELKRRIDSSIKYASILAMEEIAPASEQQASFASWLHQGIEKRVNHLLHSASAYANTQHARQQRSSPRLSSPQTIPPQLTHRMASPSIIQRTPTHDTADTNKQNLTSASHPSYSDEDFERLLCPPNISSLPASESILALAQGRIFTQSLLEVQRAFRQEMERRFFDFRSARTLAVVFSCFHLNSRIRFLSSLFQDPKETSTHGESPRRFHHNPSPSSAREGVRERSQIRHPSNSRSPVPPILFSSPTSPKIRSPAFASTTSPRIQAYLQLQDTQAKQVTPTSTPPQTMSHQEIENSPLADETKTMGPNSRDYVVRGVLVFDPSDQSNATDSQMSRMSSRRSSIDTERPKSNYSNSHPPSPTASAASIVSASTTSPTASFGSDALAQLARVSGSSTWRSGRASQSASFTGELS